MDDLQDIAHRYPEWGNKLKLSKSRIISCRQYDDFPTSEAFPIDDVLKCVQDDYFNNTVAYMVGYALLLHSQEPIEEIYLFGCDYWYPGSQAMEAGASNVTYLLGIAKGRGLHFRIPQSSTLLDANLVKVGEKGEVQRPLYGYHYNPGQSKTRIKNGTASKMDELIAAKAPKIIEPGEANAIKS